MNLLRRFLTGALLAAFILSGCQPVSPAPLPTPAPTQTAAPVHPTPSLTPLPPTAVPASLWVSPEVPADLTAALGLSLPLSTAPQPEETSYRLELDGETPLAIWTYALAGPFATYTDSISTADLLAFWRTGTSPVTELRRLVTEPSTAALLTRAWGQPSAPVASLPAEALLSALWDEPGTWAVIPFASLTPQMKVIALEGSSPLRKDFTEKGYPLSFTFGLTPPASAPDEAPVALPTALLRNRDPAKLATVLLTGVTALVRGTAALMEYAGMDYPASEIGPVLQDADILHISNEIPFASNCPSPYPWERGLVFCSQARYIELLEHIGTDVVELSGDHFADWGDEAMHFTLELYAERGWPVYGGGSTAEEAMKPVYFEVNGNRLAFIGCNYKSPGYATASATRPGAVHCDPAWLHPLITQVKNEGYLPIVTFQDEEYYEYIVRPDIQEHFTGAAEAGAVIVSGSQAHQPHAIELPQGTFLHYGLGNLFFDQVVTDEATRWAFLDRHVFYDGRHIGTELITIFFVDLAKSRFTTPQERLNLLHKVFAASGWPAEPPPEIPNDP